MRLCQVVLRHEVTGVPEFLLLVDRSVYSIIQGSQALPGGTPCLSTGPQKLGMEIVLLPEKQLDVRKQHISSGGQPACLRLEAEFQTLFAGTCNKGC